MSELGLFCTFPVTMFNEDQKDSMIQFALDRTEQYLHALPNNTMQYHTTQGNLTQHTDAILTQVLTTAAQVVVATGSTCSYNAIVHLHLLIYLL